MTLQKLKEIDYQALPLHEYSRQYLMRMMPHIDYYCEIFERTLNQGLPLTGKSLHEVTMVDYGGGHGILSMMAKEHGVGEVIYIDYNPQAVDTVKTLSSIVGFCPDVVLQGDASTLRQWCNDNGRKPDLIIGTDVIEHIYSLEAFFADIHAINPDIPMVFTTASNPYNRITSRQLRRVMVSDELGNGKHEGFYYQRRRHIEQHYPDMGKVELDMWASATRGLTFDDTLQAVETKTPNTMEDPYNTCDPATGSWTERILPIDSYRQMLQPYGRNIKLLNGHYDTHRGGMHAVAAKLLNMVLSTGGFTCVAPYITLVVS